MTTFTLDELNTILGLLDLATKAGGLQVASKALPIVQKMELMAKEIEESSDKSKGQP